MTGAVDALVERVWWGHGVAAAAMRGVLAPLGHAFGGLAAMRGALYERGTFASHALALPAVSVGNLTVGGTGKTPVAAWIAEWLLERGARPAVVLRGYGGDEPLVHAALNPQALVVADRDRVAAVARARAEGADVAVLDDAFQHRRARRDVDVVLVSADRWRGSHRPLPAGPWREPLSALARASFVLVTRKVASVDDAAEVLAAAARVAGGVPAGVAHLAPGELRGAAGERAPLAALADARVLAVSAVGDPRAFARQLEALGARVSAAPFRDHHAFSAADAAALARRAESVDMAVCTLKDAVKLWPLWPRTAPSLWYVSQRLDLELGRGTLERQLGTLLAARDAG